MANASAPSLSGAPQLPLSRSALILNTWLSLSVFQAPPKSLAAVLTWQISSQTQPGARGRHALWIAEFFRPAVSIPHASLGAKRSSCPPPPPPSPALKAIWQEGCDAAPGLFHAPHPHPFTPSIPAAFVGPAEPLHRSLLIVRFFAPSPLPPRRASALRRAERLVIRSVQR